MRWLVRFGYDGRSFAGWARQPGLRTVEGEIDHGVTRHGLPVSRAPISVASRTDRGVSAVGNVLALTSTLDGPSLLRALNGLSTEIFFTHAAPVLEAFRIRGASRRTYRYFEPSPASRAGAWQAVARRLVGRIDVRSLSRGLPTDRPQWRTVESVRVTAASPGLQIEIQAPSYVWGMVRKMVGALREVEAGRLHPDRLSEALEGRERLTLPMAEPEPLVLWDVEFPLAWQVEWTGPNRHQLRRWSEAKSEARTRERVLDAIWADGVPGG